MSNPSRQRRGKTRIGGAVTLIGLLATLAVAWSASAQDAPGIVLQTGASLRDAVTALAAHTGGVIVADVPTRERTLQRDLDGVALEEALAVISQDLDCYAVVRGRNIALQLRRWDPEEPNPLEVEEARRVAGDLERLTNLLVYPDPHEQGKNMAALVASTSPAQREQMQAEEGLPWDRLTRQQQRLVLRIATTILYRSSTQRMRDCGRAVRLLERSTLVAASLPSSPNADPDEPPRPNRALHLRVPDPQATVGFVQIRFPMMQAAAEAYRPDPQPLLAFSPVGKRVASEGEPRGAPVVMPVRRFTVAEFSADWRRVTGGALRVPAYAASRPFWICSNGATRSEIAQTVADLWNWDVSRIDRGQRLGRNPARQPEDVLAMHAGLREVFPPAILHISQAEGRLRDPRRLDREVRPIYEAIADQVGVNTPFPVDRLTAEQQRTLVHHLLQQAAARWTTHAIGAQRPPAYLADPSEIVLKLTGPPQEKPEDPKALIMIGSRSQGTRMSWYATTFVDIEVIGSQPRN